MTPSVYESEIQKRDSEIQKRDQQIAERLERNRELSEEITRLQELLHQKGASKASKKPKFKVNYSFKGKQNKPIGRRQSTGCRTQEQKSELVSKRQSLYPPDVDKDCCIAKRLQYAWRLIEGKAEYVCYTLYALEGSETLPEVPGLRNSRSEYGLEIILIVAFLHYWIGISLDNACAVLQFFTGLDLSKSQANSLLNQLSQDWSEQYDTIAEVLALQLVIYIDETGWKVGNKSCYTWAFSSAMHVLFRCGVSRGKAEAEAIIGQNFDGIGVSDDYGAYQNLFSDHQLCWAHLLRKAIKLMLQNPDVGEYKLFLDRLYRIYQEAVHCQKDERLTVGRADKCEQLKNRIIKLCTRAGEKIDQESTPTHEASFIRLHNELVKGLPSLFVFVEYPEVEATNNRSERNLRREAEIRKGGRTSKSDTSAKRRSIVMTVLATLNTRFKKFTLENLLSEIERWMNVGVSIFQLELEGLKQANAPPAN